MKKLITLSSALLGVIFLAGCGQQQASQTQSTLTPSPVVEQPTQSAATQPVLTVPTAQTADETANLQTYSNTNLGFEFQYPKNWAQPTITEGFSSGGFPNEKPKWLLNIGIIGKGPCEGADCAQYTLEGFSYLDYNSTLASLRKNDSISDIKEINVNGWKGFSYIEGGLRADSTVLILGSAQTLKFVNIWGEKKYFDQMVSTLKLTN
ncbi:MAG: hypothetical protein PHQ42_04835 [Patescibacteria group bacterium]|nr:hypothetical protein [Patescibacteria group bacterium]